MTFFGERQKRGMIGRKAESMSWRHYDPGHFEFFQAEGSAG